MAWLLDRPYTAMAVMVTLHSVRGTWIMRAIRVHTLRWLVVAGVRGSLRVQALGGKNLHEV